MAFSARSVSKAELNLLLCSSSAFVLRRLKAIRLLLGRSAGGRRDHRLFDKDYLGRLSSPPGPRSHIAATTAKPASSKPGPVHGLEPCKTAAGDYAKGTQTNQCRK